MYTGYLLTPATREMILKRFPPKYPDALAHHITEIFGVSKDYPPPDQPRSVKIIGYADDNEKVEGLLVEIDGTVRRPKDGYYHITLSIDSSKGAKPADTNKIIKNYTPVDPIDIDVRPKNFTQATKSYLSNN